MSTVKSQKVVKIMYAEKEILVNYTSKFKSATDMLLNAINQEKERFERISRDVKLMHDTFFKNLMPNFDYNKKVFRSLIISKHKHSSSHPKSPLSSINADAQIQSLKNAFAVIEADNKKLTENLYET